jgi:glycosyltransferase involved in cell wall biosynthesis
MPDPAPIHRPRMTNGTAPLSVIIPTYQRATLLHEALGSALDQTLPPAEVIVVDDGSTDDTAAVVSRLADRPGIQTRVRYLPLTHRGQELATNEGVSGASAPWIALLDSDDIWLPRRVERQFAALERTPEAGFAFCGLEAFDESGRRAGSRLALPRASDGRVLGDILEGTRLSSSSLMVRRQVFVELGGLLDLPIAADYELSLRLAARWPASHIPDVLVLKRIHAGNRTGNRESRGIVAYVGIVHAFLATHPELPRSVRGRAAQGMASAHLKLARHGQLEGDRQSTLRHLRTAARLRPSDGRVLPALLRELAGIA